jgi:hypothetical protein
LPQQQYAHTLRRRIFVGISATHGGEIDRLAVCGRQCSFAI